MRSGDWPPSETSPLLSSPRDLRADDVPATPSPTSPDPAVIHVSRADLVWILVGLWSPVFLGALDGTIVATLMTPIGNYFNKSNQASYIGTSYLLSVCCFTPLYGTYTRYSFASIRTRSFYNDIGRLSDILGRRGAMLLGLTLFGAGTICCGIAPSMEALIAARAVAGMGGGGIMTVSSVTLTDLVPFGDCTKAWRTCEENVIHRPRQLLFILDSMFGLGSGIGGPLGGWMNDTFGWRSAFLFQIPILAFSFVLVLLKVSVPISQEVKNQSLYSKMRRMDFAGSATLAITIGCLLMGFSIQSSESLPWSHPLIHGLFITSAVFAVLFAAVEAWWAPYPVMPFHLITQRTPLAVCMSNFFGSMAAFITIYNVPLYFSAVRLNSSTDTGLHLLPHSIALSSGSVFAGWIMRRTGKLYTLTLVSAALAVWSSIQIAMWSENSSQWHLWVDIVPQGFGMASVITSTLIALIACVSKTDVAVATGITYLFRTTGQVLGVSLSGTLLQSILLSKLRQRIHGPNAEEFISRIRHSTDEVKSLDPVLRKLAIESYADALRVVFICQLVLNVLALLSCTAIQENPLPGTLEEQESQYRRNSSAQQRRTSSV
ncbi:vacuolar amino acid permease [Lactarius hatsudake]|nr:vacuolar amino acid permease [Lactarius hatsudake]